MLEQSTAEDAQAQLLMRVAGGDVQAMSDFYDHIAGPLFSVARRIIGNPAEAEEIVQDVFMQIWEKASSFDPLLGSAFHWALSITRHRAIDRLRSSQRRARLVEELQERAEAEPAVVAQPDADTLMIEEAKTVRSALGSLPREQRQALELAFLAGLTHSEIAELLHQPVGTIKARIRRGLLKLRESLQLYP